MKNIILLIFIMAFLYYVPEIIYKFFLDLFSIKRTFTGDGYNLKYNSNWKKIKNNLYNSKYKCLFSPINSSNLINDLNDVEKRHLLYLEFRDYFNRSRYLIENNYNVYSGSNNFLYLKEDVYYAYFDYGTSTSDIIGRFYLIGSNKYDSLFSFKLVGKNGIDNTFNDVLMLIESIEFTDISYDEDPKSTPWYIYKDARIDSLGKKMELSGIWKVLNESEEAWKFTNNKCYWYKSYQDLSTDYYEGKCSVENGEVALKQVGYDTSTMSDNLMIGNYSVSCENIYVTTVKMNKCVKGKLKEKTPINDEIKIMWTLINHEDEGIEARAINIQTGEYMNLVKIKD